MYNMIKSDIVLLLRAGIKVRFDGYEVKSEEDIKNTVIREDDCCMRDYICDNNGEFIQVNFDILRNY